MLARYQHPFRWGVQILVPNFEKRHIRKKKECLGGLIVFLPQIAGFIMFFLKKDFVKIKYGFEASISNVDLDLF